MKATIEQQRAENALSRVNELADQPEEFRNSYRTYVDRLGPAIVMNGLGQALATEQAAAGPPPRKAPDKAAHDELYNNVQRWLCRDHGGVYPGTSDLLHAIVTHDESRYLHAQAEVLSWLDWHKKCCRALFPKDGDD